jgi:2,3-bisphosphoglycerate-dependent phosphoglycerate mutase
MSGTTSSAEVIPEYRFAVPADATDLLLVRHGASADGEPGKPYPVLDGHGDPDLSPAGAQEAERVAERLAYEPIAAIYVSTLRRTHQTAEPLARRLGLTPVVEPDLREAHLGEWEGWLWRQRVAEGHPIAQRVVTEQRWDVMPGAEDVDEFAARVKGAFERIVQRHRGETVAVFSHGGVIGQAFAAAVGCDPYPFNANDNASISQMVVTGARWKVRRFNDTTHLHPRFTLTAQPMI